MENNIYTKIQAVKKALLEANLKKSGQNKFANYNYYELADFLPSIVSLCEIAKLFTSISFTNELAVLTIVNAEKADEIVTYTSPMRELELNGCNQIQALGGVETYSRRYLYMAAFDIVENDMFDGGEPKKEETKPVQAKVATVSEELKCIACGKVITKSVQDYSMKMCHKSLCMDCQKK